MKPDSWASWASSSAGALAGTIKAGVRGYARLTRPRLEGVDDILEAFEKHVLEPNTTQRDAAHVLGNYADVMRENPFSLDHPLADQIHLEATADDVAHVYRPACVKVGDRFSADTCSADPYQCIAYVVRAVEGFLVAVNEGLNHRL